MPYPVVPGAETYEHRGGPHGVLVCHGFTGSPASVRGLAEALAGAGLSVSLPRLPGHGTHVDDMLSTGWPEWSAAVEAAYRDLAARCATVAVVGLSMGATLVAWLATRHPVVGLVAINGLFDPGMGAMVPLARDQMALGVEVLPGDGSDIARPDVPPTSYAGTPLAPVVSLLEAVVALAPELPSITCPVLVITSVQDHVVPPGSSDHLAAAVAGPVERLMLERSFHVATLDYDRDLVVARTVEFVCRVSSGPAQPSR